MAGSFSPPMRFGKTCRQTTRDQLPFEGKKVAPRTWEIELPNLRLLHFWAEVVDEASEIGFAVKFNSSSQEDQESLANYIAEVFDSPAIKRTS
jgi:hypothetical protein